MVRTVSVLVNLMRLEELKSDRKVIFAGIAIGYALAFFLLPANGRHSVLDASWKAWIFRSEDFYYALTIPLAVWWFFASFLRGRNLKSWELGFSFFLFGFYLCSAMRALGSVVVRIMNTSALS